MNEGQAKAGQKRVCPKCQGTAVNITPLKTHNSKVAVFACQACGYSSRMDGGAYITDPTELKEHFLGLIGAKSTITDLIAGEGLPKATRNLLIARITEYGLQMWNDGLKQGLLIDVIKENYDGKVRSKEGDPARGPEERGGQPHAKNEQGNGRPHEQGSIS